MDLYLVFIDRLIWHVHVVSVSEPKGSLEIFHRTWDDRQDMVHRERQSMRHLNRVWHLHPSLHKPGLSPI
jgi:hypothetical protein